MGRRVNGRTAWRGAAAIAAAVAAGPVAAAAAYAPPAPHPTAHAAAGKRPAVRHAHRLPQANVDIRLRGARRAARAATSSATDRARAALRAALGPQSTVIGDPITGGLRMLARSDGYLTDPSAADAADIALAYVRDHLDAFGLTAADLDTLALAHRSTSPDGITHLEWVHKVDGIAVFDRDLRASVTADGRLLDLQGAPLHDVGGADTDPSVTPRNALASAQRAAGTPIDVPNASAPSGPAMAVKFTGGDTARLTLFPTASGLKLAWRVIAADPQVGVTYASVIDADTGALLDRENLTSGVNAASVVDYYPGAAGAGGVQHTVDLGPWLDGPLTTTVLAGNNAHVWEDVDDDGVVDNGEEVIPSTQTTPAQWSYVLKSFTTLNPQFNPPYNGRCPSAGCTWNPIAPSNGNEPQSWIANSDENAAQVFYFVNKFHDYLAQPPVGFTTAARSFEGSDRLNARALAGAINTGNGSLDQTHLNNANMTTLPDGQSPFMRMYLFAPAPDNSDEWRLVNGGDDASVVYHEYTHGYTGRTVIDASGTQALQSKQSGAMGEAWSDWFAEDYIFAQGLAVDNPANPGDVLLGAYESAIPVGKGSRTEPLDCPPSVGGAACPGTPTAGPGGYTYADMGNILATGQAEVHADGEIWGQTLWDLRTRVGHDAALAIISGGLRLTPPNPSMLDARDAILRAAVVVGGLPLQYQAWLAFAGRGMGTGARTINGDDIHPTQDFTAPAAPATCYDGSIVADAATCPTPPPPPAAIIIQPAPKATLKLGSKKFRLATVLRKGIKLTVVSSDPGRASVSASISAKDADKAHLGTSRKKHTKRAAVGKGTVTVKPLSPATLKLVFTKDARAKLAHRPSVKVTLKVAVTSATTGRVKHLTAIVTLKR
jgi:hypothetical protein